MLLHEASIIATKERAEMKMIEFFIARKIVVDGAGHSITKRRAVVKRAGIVDGVFPKSLESRDQMRVLSDPERRVAVALVCHETVMKPGCGVTVWGGFYL